MTVKLNRTISDGCWQISFLPGIDLYKSEDTTLISIRWLFWDLWLSNIQQKMVKRYSGLLENKMKVWVIVRDTGEWEVD